MIQLVSTPPPSPPSAAIRRLMGRTVAPLAEDSALGARAAAEAGAPTAGADGAASFTPSDDGSAAGATMVGAPPSAAPPDDSAAFAEPPNHPITVRRTPCSVRSH